MALIPPYKTLRRPLGRRAIALLAKHGASLEARSADGCVPLHFAAMHGKHTIVYYLLSKGCRADLADSHVRRTALLPRDPLCMRTCLTITSSLIVAAVRML